MGLLMMRQLPLHEVQQEDSLVGLIVEETASLVLKFKIRTHLSELTAGVTNRLPTLPLLTTYEQVL